MWELYEVKCIEAKRCPKTQVGQSNTLEKLERQTQEPELRLPKNIDIYAL